VENQKVLSSIERALLLEVIAQGFCHEDTKHKEVDVALANAIGDEIENKICKKYILELQDLRGKLTIAENLNKGVIGEQTLEKALSDLLKSYSAGKESNTPEYILSVFLLSSLYAFNEATKQRDRDLLDAKVCSVKE